MKSFFCIYRHHVVLILIILVAGSAASAQHYLLRERSNVEKRFKKYGSQNNERAFVYKTDSTLRLSVQDSTKRAMDIVCFFNKRGLCYKETKTSDCDECFQKYLAEVLSNKMYKWKKVNETLFISTEFWNRCIVIDKRKPFSYSIIHEYMSKQKQKDLYKSIL